MPSLILPDSNIFIAAARAGRDPFQQFAGQLEEYEFATCGMVMLEVCRGLRDPALLPRFQERFAVMIFLPTTQSVWARATQLAWSLDRRGVVLPSPDLLIAACALAATAAVLTTDAPWYAIPGLRTLAALA